MIGIYVRVSTAQQTDKYSIPVQKERGIAFAGADEYIIYEETGSGSSIDKRPKISKLLKEIEKGLITKVWVIDSDRLTRDLQDAIILQKNFNKHNVQLYINDTYTDFSSPEKILQYHITSAVGEYERSKITERSIRGKSKWQNEGFMALPSLYGWNYKYDEKGNKVWYTVESEVKVIKLIYELFLKGYSFNKIEKHLWDRGYRNRKNNTIFRNSIKQILTQKYYIGLSRNTDGLPIESKVYKPIVDENSFYTAQALIENKPKKRRVFLSAKHELSGILKCKSCFKPFYYNGKKNKDGIINNHYYYHSKPHCNKLKFKSVKKDDIELKVSNFIFDLMQDKGDDFDNWLRSYRSDTAIIRDKVKSKNIALNGRLQEIKKGKNILLDLVLGGEITKSNIKEKMANFNKEEAIINDQITSNNKQLQHLSSDKEDKELELIYQLSLNYEELDVAQRREFYMKLFKKIEIADWYIDFTLFNGEVMKSYHEFNKKK